MTHSVEFLSKTYIHFPQELDNVDNESQPNVDEDEDKQDYQVIVITSLLVEESAMTISVLLMN